jgi:hypothetical protein
MIADDDPRTRLRRTLVLLEITQEIGVDVLPQEEPLWTDALDLPAPWNLYQIATEHAASVRQLDTWEVT